MLLQHLIEVLRKARMDQNLLEFFPQQVRCAGASPPYPTCALLVPRQQALCVCVCVCVSSAVQGYSGSTP